MNFTPPDPEQFKEYIERTKEAYQIAIDNSSGPSQPLFKKLSDIFNRVSEQQEKMLTRKPGLFELARFIPTMLTAVKETQATFQQLESLAMRDPVAGQVLQELMQTLAEEQQKLMGSMGGGGFPGFPDAGFPDADAPDLTPPRPPGPPRGPMLPPPRAPKKPGKGSFDL